MTNIAATLNELDNTKRQLFRAEQKIKSQQAVIDAVKSLNLDKVEGYMLLGKSYKDIILEALSNLSRGSEGE